MKNEVFCLPEHYLGANVDRLELEDGQVVCSTNVFII